MVRPFVGRETQMRREAIDQAAELLCRARLRRQRFAGLPPSCRPSDEAEAYAIQHALHARLDEAGRGPLLGFKIGCTTPVMQRFLQIDHPCAGGVLAPTVRHQDGSYRHGDFCRVGVECEIGVALSRDLAADGAPYDRGAVEDAVGACMAAIEIVDDRYQDYRSMDAWTLVADDFFHAGCVLGMPETGWRTLDLASLHGAMTINGHQVGSGIGGDVLGHPLNALAWLANLRATQDRPLRAGTFVLLGSVVETKWLAPGDRVEVEIERLGTASARFD
jgi:2-oxo-3-hexenedioate decarboxylase/2-keto-4-pentenoate hydratase